MPAKVVRIRDRNQITLPADVLQTAALREGDFLEVSVTSANVVTLKPQRLVAWESPEAEQRDSEAEKDIEGKRYRTFSSARAFSEDLLGHARSSTASRASGSPKTEADLVSQIAGRTGLRKKDVQETVDSFLNAVARTLQSGHPIAIRGFGTFRVQDRKTRVARKTRKGRPTPVQRRRVPVFNVSKELKQRVERG